MAARAAMQPSSGSTTTTTATHKRTPASRPYDHLYDPTYQVSSPRDHGRAEARAATSVDQVKQVPHAENM